MGWQAYADGGLELMRQVCALTEEAGAIVDKWWDRIGGKGGGKWSADAPQLRQGLIRSSMTRKL